MKFFLFYLGVLCHHVTGRSHTQTYQRSNEASTKKFSIGTEGVLELTVVCKRIVYRTTYERWWMPSSRKSVFVVTGAVSGSQSDRVDPQCLEPVTYPMMSNWFLKWSEYPHYLAINAYLDRVIRRLRRDNLDGEIREIVAM